jgi:riboflavin synthase
VGTGAEVFTGIVEELGSVVSLEGSRLRLGADVVLGDAELGASIAVNGCCLTVVAFSADDPGADTGGHRGWWEADVSAETFARTTLGGLRPGDPVNLERPVRLADRLGGHLVQGHVDAVGEVTSPAPDLAVRVDPALTRYLVEKGSVTVDGVSLTVVDALDDGFTVAVIPHTSKVTTLGRRGVGDRVNLEVDVMAKYAESLLEGQLRAASNERGAPQAGAPAAGAPQAGA